MMARKGSRYVALSAPRRLIGDLMHFCQRVPLVSIERRMNLRAVAEARALAEPRPSWVALFLKAYGRVARQWPELRRAYQTIPWPRFYEHPHSVGCVPVERRLGNEEAVLSALFNRPEEKSLPALDAAFRQAKNGPVECLGCYRRALRAARWPWPLRRLSSWMCLNAFGRWRARRFGTFGLWTVASMKARFLTLRSPLTTTLTYEALAEDGTGAVVLFYDQRVLDGPTAARVLEDLERCLHCEILTELRYLQALDAA